MARRLFEQSENTNPTMTQRLAFGRAAAASENMTLTNFVTWIQGKLAFLLKSQNLNDLPNKTTARSNLGVYGTSQVDTLLTGKADEYPTSGGALKTNNVSVYTPSADYHPSTKKYVDDNALIPIFKGYTEIGDVGSSVDERTIALGTTLTTSNYMVIGELYDLATTRRVQDITWGTFSHGTTSFGIVLLENASHVQNLRFYFIIVPASDFVSCSNS